MLLFKKDGEVVLKAEETKDERYNCPKTGAHFKFKDVFNRLRILEQSRKV